MDSDVIEILKEMLKAPKEVKNDAGRVETHDIDKLLDAVKYLQKQKVAEESDPFSCLRQAPIPHPDGWQSHY
jgi:hypothetical protein